MDLFKEIDRIFKDASPLKRPTKQIDYQMYSDGEAACYYAMGNMKEEDRLVILKALVIFAEYRKQAEYEEVTIRG